MTAFPSVTRHYTKMTRDRVARLRDSVDPASSAGFSRGANGEGGAPLTEGNVVVTLRGSRFAMDYLASCQSRHAAFPRGVAGDRDTFLQWRVARLTELGSRSARTWEGTRRARSEGAPHAGA